MYDDINGIGAFLMFFKSQEVCQLLNIRYYQLVELLRARRIPAPTKDVSGDYQWGEKDIENARAVFEARHVARNIRHAQLEGGAADA
jgi:hypothetical protein